MPRLIDADELLKGKISNAYVSRFEIENAPTIDAEPVVHCNDCIFNSDNGGYCDRMLIHRNKKGKWETFNLNYCQHGAKKMDEEAEQE